MMDTTELVCTRLSSLLPVKNNESFVLYVSVAFDVMTLAVVALINLKVVLADCEVTVMETLIVFVSMVEFVEIVSNVFVDM